MSSSDINEYLTPEHALSYLARQDRFPHRSEGEAVLLELLPKKTQRILDLGTGDGRLLYIAMLAFPNASGIGIDFSPPMLAAARNRFHNDPRVSLVDHDLSVPLQQQGLFDAIISSFAIHHLFDKRKKALFTEVSNTLSPGGVFCNLEHVTSPTTTLHEESIRH